MNTTAAEKHAAHTQASIQLAEKILAHLKAELASTEKRNWADAGSAHNTVVQLGDLAEWLNLQ